VGVAERVDRDAAEQVHIGRPASSSTTAPSPRTSASDGVPYVFMTALATRRAAS
jgi:hypothetical protein